MVDIPGRPALFMQENRGAVDLGETEVGKGLGEIEGGETEVFLDALYEREE